VQQEEFVEKEHPWKKKKKSHTIPKAARRGKNINEKAFQKLNGYFGWCVGPSVGRNRKDWRKSVCGVCEKKNAPRQDKKKKNLKER
jgi:hypothetical protein